MKQILTNILFLLGFVLFAQGQTTMDTIFLKEVQLAETKLSTHTIGSNITTYSAERVGTSNLAELLSINSATYIKQYGSLSTPSLRGTTSSHTLVLWNGIPLTSITLGMLDFSILPLANFDEVALVKGGSASVFGSGAMGGSIHFKTDTYTNKGNEIKISKELGSYGLSSNTIAIKHSKNNYSVSGLLSSLIDENKFEYINTSQIGHPLVVNDYGKIKSNNAKLDIAYRFNKKTKLAFNYWLTSYDREVQKNMTVPFSDAKQYDINKRMLLNFMHKYSNGSINIKQAYLSEDFRYTELRKNIDSKYLAESYITDIDFKYYKNKFLFNIGSAFTENKVANNNYKAGIKLEKNFSVFGSAQYQLNYLQVNSVLRKEWQAAYNAPYTPSLAMNFIANKNLKFRGKYNMNFRSPSFNDRYWAGAGATGNPNLLPENAWNKEFGFDWNKTNINFSTTIYSLDIADMIIWQQMESGTWMPNNIKQVWSRGIESSLKVNLKQLSILGNYTYTKSTNELATDHLDYSVGKQLRYVPLHKGNLAFILSDDNLTFSLNKSFIGEVITSYGVLEDNKLDAFTLTDLSVNYKIPSSPFNIDAKIKNLMNKEYQSYQNYPNPVREFLITINYKLN